MSAKRRTVKKSPGFFGSSRHAQSSLHERKNSNINKRRSTPDDLKGNNGMKFMRETACKDPKGVEKIGAFPDHDKKEMKNWHEAINYIRNPKVKDLLRKLTPEEVKENMRFAKMFVSLILKDAALYACILDILRPKLLRKPTIYFEYYDDENVEKENRESPIPTWLERLECMAARIKLPKEPFTALMPPHPEEIFKNLDGSEEDSSKTDTSSEDSKEEESSDSQSSIHFFSDKDEDDKENQGLLGYLLAAGKRDKLGNNPKTKEFKFQKTNTEDSIRPPPSKMDDRYSVFPKKIRNNPSIINPVASAINKKGSKQENRCNARGLGYQCPCYFENYIDHTTNVEHLKKLLKMAQERIRFLRMAAM